MKPAILLMIIASLLTTNADADSFEYKQQRRHVSVATIAGAAGMQVGFTATLVGAGNRNCTTSSHYSGILSGSTNVIQDSQYSFIGSGGLNTISGVYSSSIVGGYQNNVDSNCSAILGGSGNSTSGYGWAGVFGCNVAAVAAKTFHTNCLNACDTPPTATGLPYGTIFHHTGGTPPTSSYPLYIQL